MPKTLALGTVVRVENAASAGSFLTVGNVDNIPTIPSPTKPQVEVTDFDSTATEYLSGLPDFGEFSFSGNLNLGDSAGQAQMFDDAQDPDAPARDFQIDLPNQDYQFTFTGVVTAFGITAGGPNDPYKYNATVRVSGSVTATTPIP